MGTSHLTGSKVPTVVKEEMLMGSVVPMVARGKEEMDMGNKPPTVARDKVVAEVAAMEDGVKVQITGFKVIMALCKRL